MTLYIGSTIDKDPEDSEVYAIDWSRFIGVNTIASSVWNVVVESGEDSGSGATLTVDSETILVGLQSTQSRIIGGRPGVCYRVENKITFGSGPAQTKERSYYVFVKEQ
jgi:hypothetical protein